MMQKAMRDYGYVLTDRLGNETKNWTQSLHRENNVKDVNDPWNEQNLTLAGASPQCEYDLGEGKNTEEVPLDNVPFASLANGVRRFPSLQRGDGLDLTRCVEYAKAHHDEPWLFPRDFAELTKKLGGPITVEDKHYDHVAFARWKRNPNLHPLAPEIKDTVVAHSTSGTVASQSTAALKIVSQKSQAKISKPSQGRISAARAAIKARKLAKVLSQPFPPSRVVVDSGGLDDVIDPRLLMGAQAGDGFIAPVAFMYGDRRWWGH
jgi:hypothetical protein